MFVYNVNMGKVKYTQRVDGEGFVVPLNQVYRLACCDCGLVHDVVWAYDKKAKLLGMAARRNKRATAQVRRKLLNKEK